MQKVDMGIAIVCMINNTALKEQNYLNIVNLTFVTKSDSNNDTFDSECQTIKYAHGPKKFVCFCFYSKFYNYKSLLLFIICF